MGSKEKKKESKGKPKKPKAPLIFSIKKFSRYLNC